ncbi:MAG: hypothetical protein RIS38_68 [Verrucomicrobiota bacterium]|jgi:hypothetical protein
MCAVKLKKPMHPVAGLASMIGVTLVSCLILYYGIPGTSFNGLRTGVFFPMDAEFSDARFMDNQIKCDSREAAAQVRAALRKINPDYPVDKVVVQLTNYSSGYKFQVAYQTYYAQRLAFGGGKLFRRGAEVGDPAIDAEVKAKDEALEKAIRDSLEAYFKSKGAHG